jgi:ParB family chromosome partitioning protein
MITDGELTQGQARPLLSLPDVKSILGLADIIRSKELSARDAEKLVKDYLIEISGSKQGREKDTIIKDNAYIKEAAGRLTERFGRKVKITPGLKKGKLEIEFYNEDDLQLLIDSLL